MVKGLIQFPSQKVCTVYAIIQKLRIQNKGLKNILPFTNGMI